MGDLKMILDTLTVGGAGVWVGVLMFGLYLFREYRETRKLSAEDRLARRDGYAKQVTALQAENRELRDEMHNMRKEHADYRKFCEDQHDADRKRMRDMEDEITGMKRAIAAGQVAAMETLPPNLAPKVIKDAAERSGEHMRRKDSERTVDRARADKAEQSNDVLRARETERTERMGETLRQAWKTPDTGDAV